MCGLIRAPADVSSCGRWKGLTGKELELEHQEEKAAVWLTFLADLEAGGGSLAVQLFEGKVALGWQPMTFTVASIVTFSTTMRPLNPCLPDSEFYVSPLPDKANCPSLSH